MSRGRRHFVTGWVFLKKWGSFITFSLLSLPFWHKGQGGRVPITSEQLSTPPSLFSSLPSLPSRFPIISLLCLEGRERGHLSLIRPYWWEARIRSFLLLSTSLCLSLLSLSPTLYITPSYIGENLLAFPSLYFIILCLLSPLMALMNNTSVLFSSPRPIPSLPPLLPPIAFPSYSLSLPSPSYLLCVFWNELHTWHLVLCVCL